MMTSFYKSQKTSTQRPKTHGLTVPCSRASTASFPIQGQQCSDTASGICHPPRQENWYFRRGTAAGIHMEKVLSYAAVMGRVGSREGTQGRALSTTKQPDRRKNVQ